MKLFSTTIISSCGLAAIEESYDHAFIIDLSWDIEDHRVVTPTNPVGNWIIRPPNTLSPSKGCQRIVMGMDEQYPQSTHAYMLYKVDEEPLYFTIGTHDDPWTPRTLYIQCPEFLRCDLLAHEYDDTNVTNYSRIEVSERSVDDYEISFPEGFWAPEILFRPIGDLVFGGYDSINIPYRLLASSETAEGRRSVEMYQNGTPVSGISHTTSADGKSVGFKANVVNDNYEVTFSPNSYLHKVYINEELSNYNRLMDSKRSPLIVIDVVRKFDHFEYSLKGSFDYSEIRDLLVGEPTFSSGTVGFKDVDNSNWVDEELDVANDDGIVAVNATVNSYDYQRMRFSSDYKFIDGSTINVSLIANHSVDTPCQIAVKSGVTGICSKFRPIGKLIKNDVGECEVSVQWVDHSDDVVCSGPIHYAKPPLEGETDVELDSADCYE